MPCVYCGGNGCSREHVFSSCVLKTIFGDPIRNTYKLPSGKVLLDHESTIKDVCRNCNSALSPYDTAGKEFIVELNNHVDPTNVRFKFSNHVV
jgi:hypothetical protein